MLPHENPNVDRRLSEFLKAIHLQAQAAPPPPPMDFSTMPYEQLAAVMTSMEPMLRKQVEGSMGTPPAGSAPPEHLEIDGIDGNRVPIDIYTPTAPGTGPQLCIVYLHGGGMAFASPAEYRAFLRQLSDLGAVVVAPYFRNSPQARFPAGVHDCLSAVLWARDNLTRLGADRVALAGESGGGLLALTVPLVAVRRGLDPKALLTGIWADAPVCFGMPQKAEEPLRSHIDNDGYLFGQQMRALLCRLYTDDMSDSCAFPMNADTEALRQFPRTQIVVYEFDPLRDEGLAFYRKMNSAGHPDVDCMQIQGLLHSSMLMLTLKPEFAQRQIARILAFLR